MNPAQVAQITRAKALWETIKILGLQNEKLALQAIEAALRDAPQAEGWVIVPVEPTNAMAGRFFDAIEGGPDWDDTPDDDEDKVEAFAEFSKGYRAMLAARPSAPTAVEPDEPLSWNCTNGCGSCGVKLVDFVKHAQILPDGTEVPILTVPQIVSTCCGSDVEVWDERKQDITATVEARASKGTK